jgi:hypothetical protein
MDEQHTQAPIWALTRIAMLEAERNRLQDLLSKMAVVLTRVNYHRREDCDGIKALAFHILEEWQALVHTQETDTRV